MFCRVILKRFSLFLPVMLLGSSGSLTLTLKGSNFNTSISETIFVLELLMLLIFTLMCHAQQENHVPCTICWKPSREIPDSGKPDMV